MGLYINIGNEGFKTARNGEYVDKSGLISVINSTLNTEQQFSCVTRCRRFGKSMAAKMLCAYYDQSCDSRNLFSDLAIASDPTYEQHLNKYPVIYLDITSFTTIYRDDQAIVEHIQDELKKDLIATYPDLALQSTDNLMGCLIKIVEARKQKFIMIIDEWDAICREFSHKKPAVMDAYVDLLRLLFKTNNAVRAFAGVYMTGILPIKKYKTESALNNFIEYSMVEPGNMAQYFGFTRDEVKKLAKDKGADYDELEKWYDGYQIGDEMSMFNPNSVMEALRRRRCRSYWASTGAFEAVADYIQMGYEGLRDDITAILGGARCYVDPTGFQNDMSVITSKDDVLTVLIHLGYLSYNWQENECYIPNREVAGEMVNAVKANKWEHVVKAIEQSRQLLQATLNGDEEAVARCVEAAHDGNTSILSYNDENSLSCVLSIAYYYARNDYFLQRELPTGKGFADLVLIPRKHVASPAILLELKYNKDADTAIKQIRERRYTQQVSEYTGDIILVGINYDKATKHHECRIERAQI